MKSKRDHPQKRKGIFVVVGAVMMGVLFGFLALAFDLGWLYHQRRYMQAAADAGSFYGGQAIRRGDTSAEVETEAKRGSTENGFTEGVEGATVRADNPPTTGNYVGDDFAVEVQICQPQKTYWLFRVFSGWPTGSRLLHCRPDVWKSPNTLHASPVVGNSRE